MFKTVLNGINSSTKKFLDFLCFTLKTLSNALARLLSLLYVSFCKLHLAIFEDKILVSPGYQILSNK